MAERLAVQGGVSPTNGRAGYTEKDAFLLKLTLVVKRRSKPNQRAGWIYVKKTLFFL